MEDGLGIIIILGAVTGGITAVIYNVKGHSTGGGFFLGFLFSFVGVIIALMKSPAPDIADDFLMDSGRFIRCTSCWSAIPKHAKVCKFCRGPVGATVPAKEVA